MPLLILLYLNIMTNVPIQSSGLPRIWALKPYGIPSGQKFCNDYFIYTDSDVVPADFCPADFVDYFLQELKKHPLARKIGFL